MGLSSSIMEYYCIMQYFATLLCTLQLNFKLAACKIQNPASRSGPHLDVYSTLTGWAGSGPTRCCCLGIEFKVLLMLFKVLHGIGPKYIVDLLIPYQNIRNMRFRFRLVRCLHVPWLKSNGARDFSIFLVWLLERIWEKRI